MLDSSICTSTTASVWQNFVSLFCAGSEEDKALHAQFMLSSSIKDIESLEKQSLEEMSIISKQVRDSRSKHSSGVKDLLINSVRLRKKLTILRKKKNALSQHLETLQSSTLNQQVIASVKHTSSVLKNMGLDEQIESVDAIMLDLNESMQDTQNIQQTLSSGLECDGTDSTYLDKELELLLSDDCFSDSDYILQAPSNANNMQYTSKKSTTKVTTPATAEKHENDTKEPMVVLN